MSKICFVIPTYNRAENLALTLRALALQTTYDFRVVVSDDGSTDNTREVVDSYRSFFRIKYTTHPHDGYRVSLVRNRGMRIVGDGTTHVWFIDSDVVLNPRAVERGLRIIEKRPNTVVCGRYDWLPPMKVTKQDLEKRWEDLVSARLPRYRVDHDLGIVGDDPRKVEWNCQKEISVFRGATLSGNLIVPMSWLVMTGGFDENIEGQGQDCEFGYHLQELGAKVVFCECIRGYHLSHYRDKEWMTKSVRNTIRYIHKKYDVPLREEQLPK